MGVSCNFKHIITHEDGSTREQLLARLRKAIFAVTKPFYEYYENRLSHKENTRQSRFKAYQFIETKVIICIAVRCD